MYIPNDDTQDHPFCRLKLNLKRLNSQIDVPTNQIQVPKVVKPTNKKSFCKTLGTSVINSPISPLSPMVQPPKIF